MAEASSIKELASTDLNVGKVMVNATYEVHNSSINLIDESIVELGQQLSLNRGVTSEKSNLATVVALKSVAGKLPEVKETSIVDSGHKLIATGDGEATENFELYKANFVRRVNDEQGQLTTDKYTDLQAENRNHEEDNEAEN
ncbi:hypothetical protein H5410_030148 [Solanum commersonii]|uniref:Uncharacterized protein n=1 Tax=Solanum commersonii TaxID=4109 RepID=A0A9J5YEX0_SOLCO|nr:hypothetical protein H5410_030148 [Solanum commersonii]